MKLTTLVSLTTFTLALSACFKTGNSDVPQSVLATVNGHEIRVQEFTKLYNQIRTGREQTPTQSASESETAKLRVLNEMVVMSLVRQEAAKKDVWIAKEEVQARLVNWRDSYPPGGFDEMLNKQNTTLDYIKQRIEDQLLIEKIADTLFRAEILVSDEEVKDYFKEHERDFVRPERIHAYQILVPSMEEAQKIRAQVVSNEISFESAARKFSISPDSTKGGDIGFFAKNEKLNQFNAAFELNTGEVSKPIQTKYGAHLLKVVEKQLPSKLTFEGAKNDIAKLLRNLKQVKVYKEWVTKLLRDGEIFRNDSLFAALE